MTAATSWTAACQGPNTGTNRFSLGVSASDTPDSPDSHGNGMAVDGDTVANTSQCKPYRIIYQIDAAAILAGSKDVDEYLNGTVRSLGNSHAGALFWHDGAGGEHG